MSGWQLAGAIAAVWYAASFVIAAVAWVFVGRKPAPAPQPELSDGAVDAIFDLMVQDLKSKDGQS